MPTAASLTLSEFVARWSAATLTERAGYQEHFRDLCALLGQRTPAEADPTGAHYAFEKGVRKSGNTSGRVDGFADVWQRGHFAIEYKGKKKNLSDAYQQLLAYREDLENPPLLAVCDLNRFEVHTNFTGTVKRVFAFDLAELEANQTTQNCSLPPLEVLRALFESPSSLRPEQTTAAVTEEAAKTFGLLARSLTVRGHDPHTAAHFLIRLLFCLFAEDVKLLPEGLFTKLATNYQKDPARFDRQLQQLFGAMASGGDFGTDAIKHFNGGLFDDALTIALIESELAVLAKAAALDWSSIEPSVFGTLFERSLDPAKRSQLGAHYTSREDIALIVEPVVMLPLRREWALIRAQAEVLAQERDTVIQEQEARGANLTPPERAALVRRRTEKESALTRLLAGFTERLADMKVLDPACGSGNFLYVALRSLLDLEKSVIQMAAHCGLMGFFPRVGSEQMRGLEINDYAHELAPITVWIGYIQWLRENGFGQPEEPILRRFELIKQQDAILNADGTEAQWPQADFIIGNPPFLGGSKLRRELGDEYAERLWKCYAGRVEGGADLVTYWFEKSRALIESGQVKRAGLISTNSIRNGASRKVLERVQETGGIFDAWADREWVLAGAAVNVSMVCFDAGKENEKHLDGKPVATINADLTAQKADVTTARILSENSGLAYQGPDKSGSFDLESAEALAMLSSSGNPNGKPNSDVIRRRLGGQDVTGRDRKGYVVDFGVDMSEDDASLYEAPFEYVRRVVKPERDKNRDASRQRHWWRFGRTGADMRKAIKDKERCIVTPEVSKYRVFAWMPTGTVPDKKLHVFARDDDYFFGVLHSRIHEAWSLATGSTLEDRPSYASRTTFGTFPMPWPPGQEPSEDDSPTVKAIADAARRLVELRGNWLSPPDLPDAELKKRTLTNLYNARPAWLATAHRKLDEAVAAAYGWDWPLEGDEILEKVLALNQARCQSG
ncbi:class I SAM-dependent DNA methyltransferase [Armatimonas sp.]|uniref:class I SAM-dependent DNA methyltransferase n=1 Tax=Armatimonas sp. TaxID=1872638 RepID=UPI00374FE39B